MLHASNLLLQFRMADWLDKLLMLVGVLAAILHGAAMPVAVLIFSQSIDFFVADSIAKKQIT